MRWLLVVAVVVVFLQHPSIGLAQQSPPMMWQIYMMFVATDAAVTKCLHPDAEKKQRFKANQKYYEGLSKLQLKTMFPEKSNDLIDKTLMEGADGITQHVRTIVDSDSCSSKRVAELIKPFDSLAGIGYGPK
ncbi:MAG: hypothetical protein H7Z12_04535 [Rhodospirillaceae bacterium]|nr:hypothetical protein [Rhodospirillales bacterium]